MSDSFKSFFFMLLVAASIWLFIKNRIKINTAALIIGLLAFIDLVVVNSRYLSTDDFVSKSRASAVFNLREVDKLILEDTDPHYRVLDLSINTFNSSMSSYHHKTIGGYHAAKLQRYQDLVDRHIAKGNMEVLNMLNTKYFIQGELGQEIVQRNDQAFGNAWFVDTMVTANNANEEIDLLAEINLSQNAVVHEEFQEYIQGFEPVKSGEIKLKHYSPDSLIYESTTETEQFAVFSEIWYGPGKGWKAYINGKESDFIRVNYALRGMKIPAGNHEIVFEFRPESYYLGENISFASSGLLLILLLLALAIEAWNKFKPGSVKS